MDSKSTEAEESKPILKESGTTELEDLSWAKLVSLNSSKCSNYEVKDPMVTIGRLPVNSLVINEKRISGCHCRIIKQTNEREETVVVIEDLSSNGTFVNDEKVGKGSSKVLKNGDEIMLLQKQRVGPADMTGFILAIHEGEVDAPRKRSRREKDDIELEKDHEEAIRRLKLGDSVEEEKKTEAPKTDKLKESVSEELTCGICIDILYQCVTLIPCFHSFCGCCFSDYLLKKKDCPQCREEVTEVRRNPTINNLAESYLESHPEEKRTEEEYKAMRDGNRLTVDRLKISDLTRTSKANTEERRKLAVSRPEGSGVVSSSSGSGAGRDEGKKSALERKRTRKSPGFESDGSAPSDHGEDDDTSESSEDEENQLDADNVVVQALAGSNAVQTVIVTSTVVHAIYPSPTGLVSPSDAISAENPFAINTGSVLIPLLEESDYKS
eukprot:CAMPEP_0114988774 /NCGR_PEP_ID=MMETSP0216-20121206/9801_1 /TAXON_ID=223996 /ORGANISM="Protocruzia adherens, Strain Boccale" /LENGTH=438 /DNA_ID=CAMNT_0002351623 /DNA_START=285 /DNA_END=1602 /DNA_ORIENTATION=+